MAFTKTPMQSTEQTKLLPLMFDWSTRTPDNAKDTDPVNVVWDLIPNKSTGDGYIEAIKREGLSQWNAVTIPPDATGIYYWDEASLVVVAGSFGLRAYVVDGTLSWSTATLGFDNSSIIGFTNFLYEDGHSDLVVTDGSNIATVTTAGVVTQITDPDFPGAHVPYPVFLDGYLFVATTSGNLWNSDNNNPQAWTASNFITSEAYADKTVALARIGVYIAMFGAASIEFFYDAANPTGTPLAKYSASTPRIGYKGGLATYGDSLYFVGNPMNGNASLCRLTGVKVEIIGTPTSNRIMEVAKQNTKQDFPGHIYTINGHALYSWNSYFFGIASPQPGQPTYMYDIDNEMWSRIQTPKTFVGVTTNVGFPAKASTYVFRPVLGAEPFTLVLFFGDDQVYSFLSTVYQDSGLNYTVQFTTRKFDFGTYRMKFGSRLLVWGDQTTSTSVMNVSWSDDDYQTFSTPRSVDLNSKYQHLYALGSFRTRAFRVTYSDNFPMRWQAIELDYDQGSA